MAATGGGGGGGAGNGTGAGGRRPLELAPRLVVLAGRKGKPSLLPFVAVLLALAVLGLVALLLLNTALNKGAFTLKQQRAEQTRLTQEAERIQQSLAGLSEPGALASRASALGMVPNGNPAFLDPNSGAVLGSPSAAATPTPSPSPSVAVGGVGAGAVPGAAVLPATPAPTGSAASPSSASSPTHPPTPKPTPTPTATGVGR